MEYRTSQPMSLGVLQIFCTLAFTVTSVSTATAQSAAIIVKSTVSFSGNSVIVDSYNSADPNFSTGGLYDPSKTRDNGDIICNGTSVPCISVGNAEIYGHVSTGPGGTVSIGANGAVGSHAWQSSNNGIEPNGTEGQVWYSHTANISLPSVAAPYSYGLSPGPPIDIVIGNVTNHYDASLSNGRYYYSGTLAGNVVVLGTNTLYLPNGFTGSATFTIVTNARLFLYVGGSSCSIGPLTNLTTYAGAFQLWCLPTVANLTSTYNGALIGTVYAPDTAVTLLGGGASTFSLCGSLAAASLTLNGHQQFHFDEALNVPPVFSIQPQDQAIVLGSPYFSFSATAAGIPPISYQWRFNGAAIPGATNVSLTISNPTPANAGIYSLLASNPFGATPSSNATLNVYTRPTIAQQPVSQAAVLNSNVVFQVTATGTAPLAYQWRLNGQTISGGTNSTFAIGSVQTSNVGSYTVVVTNNYGAATSGVATLSVATPPDFLWARVATNANNTGYSEGSSMAIDASGNVFVAGDYNGWGVDFGGAIFTNVSSGGHGNFICKYDANGNLVWARQYGTNWLLRAKVAADGAGNVYVAGDYQGTISFGTNVLNSGGQEETYLAKFDSQGNALWARRIGAYDQFEGWPGRALATDTQNGVLLVGMCTNIVDFGTTNLTGYPAFLANYDANGNLLWASGVASRGAGVVVGPTGMIYVSGMSVLSPPAVLAKYSPAGQLIWSRPFADSMALALDPDENIYITGMGKGTNGDLILTNQISDFYLAKCSSSGSLAWSRQIGSTNQQGGTAIALDSFRNVYIGATSASARQQASLNFGNSTITNFFGMLIKYDAAGNPLWAKGFPGTNRATPWGLAALNPGAVYVAGTFYFSAQFGNFTFTTPNNALFVAKMAGMEPPALPQITGQPLSQKVRAGTTPSLNVTVPSGIPLSYQWYFNTSNAVGDCTNASLVFTNVQTNASGGYQVTVANAYGSVTSSVANLTVYLTEAASLSSTVGPFPSNHMQFQISGVPGFNYAVEASTNLINWIPLVTNTAPFLFSDPNAAAFPNRYYRVRWVPGQ